ncbi:MAG: nuclear transport factor 2 family protein [Roseateles sp.]|nr:MAG: nuclear transport factor 2 family protein [Roseateles sp.]
MLSLGLAAHALAAPPADEGAPSALTERIASLDDQVFEAFNRCAEPGQLERHASFFAEGVEFYHDQGGVTWNRADMLVNTRRHACGHYRRELVPGSLRVYPIKGFGAIEQGVHRFCQSGADRCEGAADFLIIWQRDGERWLITRVVSYGHRAL